MSPKDVLLTAKDEEFTWVDYYIKDGNEVPFNADQEEGTTTVLELFPGLSALELEEFVKRLPAPLPSEIEELLRFSSGFSIGSDEVRFTSYNTIGFEFQLPQSIQLHGDGRGNSWIIEINPTTGDWRDVWFQDHDPAVIVYQCETIQEYIRGVLDQYRFERCVAGHRSILSSVDQQTSSISLNKRRLPRASELRSNNDSVLSGFLEDLEGDTQIVDLRSREPGGGFWWHGWRSIERAGNEPLFGLVPNKGILQRIGLRR